MSALVVALIVFACVLGGALLGMFSCTLLPDHHLSSDSKDAGKLGMGLIGTMAALVLGLLVAAAKGSYDAQSAEMTQMSANVAVLDRMLALYGPETKEARTQLHAIATRVLDQLWSRDGTGPTSSAPTSSAGERLYATIQELSPKND